MERFIVAEVTKSWAVDSPMTDLLCQQFEKIININDQRGYKLIEWKMMSVVHKEILTETIIAIFELKEKP